MLSCIGLHESRIADYIGCKNAGEAAVDAFFGHEGLPSENAAPWGEFYECSDQVSIA
jgi:hypothetical protein